MSTNQINIVIKEDGSRVVKRNLDDLGTSAEESSNAIETLKGAIEGIVAAEGVRQILEMINSYQELHNQLVGVTQGQANLNAVWDKLADVAAATHSSIADNVQEFSTLTQATHDLGLSQKQVIDFQTQLNEAVKISGVNGKTGADAVNQLAKSLTTGRLEGAAFTRTLQQVPVVGDILSKSLGVTRGQLKDMADQGDLSAQQLVDAFAKAAPQLQKQFQGLTPTIGEAFDELKDQLENTVGAFSTATGAGTGFAGIIQSVTDFIKEITPEVVSFGHALTDTLDPSTELTTGMKVFATILVVIIDSLKLVVQLVITGVVGAFSTFGTLLGGLGAAISDWASAVASEFMAIVKAIEAVPLALADAAHGDFAAAGKDVADAFSKPWNDGLDSEKRAADEFTSAIGDAGASIYKTYSTQYDQVITGAKNMWTQLDHIWDEGSRKVQAKPVVGAVSTKKGTNVTTQYSATEIAATTKALQQLLATYQPIAAATEKLSIDEQLLVKAQKEGIITKDQESQYLQALIAHYKDILDPIGAYMTNLQEEITLGGMLADQKDIENTIYQLQQKYKNTDVTLTNQQTDAIRAKLAALQETNKQQAVTNALYSGSQSQQKLGSDRQLTGIQSLLNNPTSGFNKNDATNALSQQNPDLFANTTEQTQANAQKFQTMYDLIDAMRQKDLISEQTQSGMKAKVWSQQQASMLQTSSDFFGDLSQLQHSSNKELAAVGKAAAIAQATIQTYNAATGAYAAMASIPYVGPALGAAAAAAAIVAGLANIAKIESASTGFMTGGSFTVPGNTGGSDSQMVAFRATPGERVSVATPAQVRKGDGSTAGSAGNAPPAPANNRIINVMDPGIVGDYLGTPEGEQVVVNVIRRNRDVLQTP